MVSTFDFYSRLYTCFFFSKLYTIGKILKYFRKQNAKGKMQNAQSPMQKPEAKNKDNYDF